MGKGALYFCKGSVCYVFESVFLKFFICVTTISYLLFGQNKLYTSLTNDTFGS